MNNYQLIKVSAKKVEKDGKKFVACSSNIRGIWYKIKFTQECENQPKTQGIYDITFDLTKSSIKKGKPYIKRDGTQAIENDIIWIREIIKIHKYSDEELERETLEKFKGVFGDKTFGNTDDLPF